ncbi:MAG: Zn-ribbon domain-containing OB-fold protein [Deltaproteobacteria bacterium]|nr:Zn-ribbon domain-containing OB-fold protein [Deltaproteobacteria bacterium]
MKGIDPRPLIDDDSRSFWEGAREQRLMIQRCGDCGKAVFYPRCICPHCFSEKLSWIQASGRGRIHSYTVVHRALPPFKDQTPYVVALIDLEEGVRMISRVVSDRRQVAIDKPVSVVYVKVDDEVTLPCFEVSA